MCAVGGRIGWIGTRSGAARRPGIADPTTKEEMQDEACSLYGMTGMFFSTDESHFIPYPCEEDYIPGPPPPVIDEEETDDDESVEEVVVGPAPAPAPVPFTAVFLERLRVNVFEGRRKLVDEHKLMNKD